MKTIENLGLKVIPSDYIDELIAKKYFKLFVPKSLGGLELSLNEALPYLIQTAEVNPSLGWLHNLCAGANYFCGFFNPSKAEEIFGRKDVVTSGSGKSSGTFRETTKGYVINGKWDKCTGAIFATHLTCVAKNEENSEEEKTFILPAELILVKDDWTNFGLKASASYSFEVFEFFVEKDNAFEINVVRSFENFPIYSVPFDWFARVCLSASLEGILKHLIKNFKEEIRNPKPSFLQLLEKLENTIETLHFKRKDLVYLIENNVDNNNIAKVSEGLTLIAQLHKDCYNIVAELYYLSGIRITEEDSPLNWTFKDFLTAIQHFMLK